MSDKWYRMQDENGVAHIEITTGIGGFFGLTADEFIGELNGIEAKELRMLISSGGGSVFEGVRMFNALLEWKEANNAVITARVSSLAASMASIMAMAADKIEIYRNSFFMVHEAATESFGNAGDLERDADLLRKINENGVDAYMRHATVSREEMSALVAAETWLDAKQSVEVGLAHVIIDEDAPSASFDLSAFTKDRIPEAAMQMVDEKTEAAEVEPQTDEQEEQNVPSEPESDDAETQGADADDNGTDDAGEADGTDDESTDDEAAEVEPEDDTDDSEIDMSLVNFEDYEASLSKVEELRASLTKTRQEHWDELAATHSEHESEMAAVVSDFQAKIAEVCERHAEEMQAQKDAHAAEREQDVSAVADMQSRLDRLTGGMRGTENTEAPSGVMSFEAAIKECGGGEAGYIAARAKYPEIYKAFMAER